MLEPLPPPIPVEHQSIGVRQVIETCGHGGNRAAASELISRIQPAIVLGQPRR
jgi:hypothetical protein